MIEDLEISTSPLFESKQENLRGSRAIIFSLVVTMSGASLLSYPYTYSQAGILGGPLLAIIAYGITATTAGWVVKHVYDVRKLGIKINSKDSKSTPVSAVSDYAVIVNALLGPRYAALAQAASLLAVTGATVCYFIFLSDVVFSILCSVTGSRIGCNIQDLSTEKALITMMLYAFLLVVVSSLRDVSVLISISSYGFIVFAAIILLVLTLALTADPITDACPAVSEELFKPGIFRSGGVLLLAFFSHNIILSIMAVHAHPTKKQRDTWIAFGVVCAITVIVGLGGYRAAYCSPEGVPQDFSVFFGTGLPAVLVRLLLVLDLLVIFPIVLMVVRSSFEGLVSSLRASQEESDDGDGDEEEEGASLMPKSTLDVSDEAAKPVVSGFARIIAINAGVLLVGVLVSLFYPHVADVLSLVGAFAGGIYVLLLPSLCEHKIRMLTGLWNTPVKLGVLVMNILGGLCVLAQFVYVMPSEE